MQENNNSDKAEQESIDDPQKCCPSTSGDSTCCSSTSGSYSKGKFVIFALIAVAAVAVLARSLTKESTAVNADAQQFFAAFTQEKNCESFPQTNAQCADPQQALAAIAPENSSQNSPETNVVKNVAAPDKTDSTLWRAELASLASLNKVATNTDAVFVFLAADDQQDSQTITKTIEAAAKKIQSDGSRICAFKLKKDAPDYAQLAKQFSTPCVVALVKGCGMSTVSGQINEAKLIQAFVTASRPASSCCPPGSTACPPVGPRR